MCGIIGYLGKAPFQNFVVNGLKLLQNRGYDSVGICTIEDGELKTTKFASTENSDALQQLNTVVQEGVVKNTSIGIGHTRWATHGGKTQQNAHPHHDNRDRIALVHNGIIENFADIKNQLLNQGYFVKSQTDTEVIAVLIGKYLDEHLTVEHAIRRTVSELSGTWALTIIHRDFPDKIWITRNGSPLLLGMDTDFIMVASEQIAFGNHIKKYIVMDNHDLIEITKTDGSIVYNQNIHRYPIQEKLMQKIEYIPLNYDHWMLKEIMEQPDAVERALNHGGRIKSNTEVKIGGLDDNRDRIFGLDHLILLGCGTSYHAGLWSLAIFKTLDIFDTVTIYDGAEFSIKDIPKKGKTGLILLSQSGETKDLHRCLHIAKEFDLATIGIVNVPDSMIARETDCGVYLNAGREVAVASTKSFTSQCVVLTLVAIWFSQNKGTCMVYRRRLIQDLRNLSFHIQNVLKQRLDTQRIVERMFTNHNNSMFILGKDQEEAIAKEGALKMKEIPYVHAEGYSSSALKHGPFALITKGLPIVLLDVNETYRDKTRNAYQEVLAREAMVVCIGDRSTDVDLTIDKNGTFGGILANVYLQMMSYFLALNRGVNPDFPRNLAKVVTVE